MTEKERQKIIIIAGPTAVGKTRLTIELAKRFNGEIVSCDSMQIYKYMDIGSAKPTPEEMAQVPHHLVDFVEPSRKYTVCEYSQDARKAIDDIASRGKLPFVTGGTGLYINSFIYDMDFSAPPPEDSELRKKLYEEAEEFGKEYVHEKLREIDPESAERIHPNNLQKIVRAIESAKCGCKIGDFSKDIKLSTLYDPILICLDRDRKELYDRINQRADMLFEAGLEEEVRSLMERGLTEEDISMCGIGYKEVIRYIKGEITKEEALELVQKNTRHYAKRQLSWFRRYSDMKWFNLSSYANDRECEEDMVLWLKKQL